MKNLFNSVKMTGPKSNTFDLTHDVKMSGRMGELMPCMQMECVPGDRVSLGADSLVRFAPLIAPVMHRFNTTIHYFFVPNRILWDGWKEWMETQGDSAVHPYISVSNATPDAELRFLEYMGIPNPARTGGGSVESINAFPLAAYQKIYDDYYRDQNLIQPVFDGLTAGSNVASPLSTMRNRAWMHDYFSAALPFAQKGAEVDIPLGDVTLSDPWATPGNVPTFRDSAGNVPVSVNDPLIFSGNSGQNSDIAVDSAGAPVVAYDPDGTLKVEPTSINELRRAFRLQEWLEKMARGGSRYIEQIKAHFGVRSSDKRLDRPEYITGVKTPVTISEVLNSTGQVNQPGEDPGLPQGNMAGHAVSVGTGNVGSYFVEEHGWIIGIMSITPMPAYMQGIFKPHTHRTSILDYYWPSFAHIGEQEILQREIYAYHPNGNDTFGYIPRYAEYRYMPNRVAGQMTSSLMYWHAARYFPVQPALNKNFVEVNAGAGDTSLSRIFAVQTPLDDHLFIHVINKVRARRLMPTFGTPNL